MLSTEKSALLVSNYTWTFFFDTAGKGLKLIQAVAMPEIEWEEKVERITRIRYSNKFLVIFSKPFI